MPKPAEIIFRDVLKIDPSNAMANYGLGKIYHYFKNDPATAEEYYATAIASDPENLEALQSYAILAESKDPAKAKSLYDQALQADPENAEVHFNYTILLKNFFKDNMDEAKLHYLKATQSNPEFIRENLDLLFGIKR
jgi:Tfp pilus assembly protein PilF